MRGKPGASPEVAMESVSPPLCASLKQPNPSDNVRQEACRHRGSKFQRSANQPSQAAPCHVESVMVMAGLTYIKVYFAHIAAQHEPWRILVPA
jgi:hypothetical protein